MKKMNDKVCQELKKLVTTYGSDEISTNIRKTEGLLRDFCGEHKREIAVLIRSMEQRIPEEINTKGDSIDQFQFSRLVKKLHDNEGTSEEYAKWAVESWAVALGKNVETKHSSSGMPALTTNEEIDDEDTLGFDEELQKQMDFTYKPKTSGTSIPPARLGENWQVVSTFHAAKYGIWPVQHNSALKHLIWSPDSDSLITTSGIGRVWDIYGRQLKQFNGTGRVDVGVSGVTFQNSSYRHRLLATACGQGKLFIWEEHKYKGGPSRRPLKEIEIGSKSEWVTDIAWNPAEENLIAVSISHEDVSKNGTLAVFDISSKRMIWSQSAKLLFSYDLIWSAAGNMLAVLNYENTDLTLFSIKGAVLKIPLPRENQKSYGRYPRNFSWHPSGKYFTTRISDEKLGIFESSSLKCLYQFETKDKYTGGFQWSTDGKNIAITNDYNKVKLFNLESMEYTHEFLNSFFDRKKMAPKDDIWSPDGQRIAFFSTVNTLGIYDTVSGSTIKNFEASSKGICIERFKWSPDSSMLAFADRTGLVTIVKLQC